ncbi:MAG: HPr(Ser) kinase/phosphatase [Elusimicrobia bacterium]|nr:HPr(Ser) kinase/phosphatase [Elusimicrobiota bacterium]
MPALTVEQILKDERAPLKLKVVCGGPSLKRKVVVPDANRPGLALAGYLKHFRSERVQVIGRGENNYCQQENPKTLSKNLNRMLARPDIPFLVITRDLPAPKIVVEACRRAKVALLKTEMETAQFVGELTAYLEDRLSPSTIVHGVLVDVYGMGVLIQGESGIGKSECALELLKRGHILVSDDAVNVIHKRGDTLIGSCPEPLRHFMEVRGLGIIDVKLLFGIGAVLDRSRIELIINLVAWDPSKQYERTGLLEETISTLNVSLPMVRIPVSPGRNLAILIEVAALNQRLKTRGYFSAQNFNERLIRRMRKNAKHAGS